MSSVKLSEIGDNICLLTLDMPGKSANVLTDDVYADLDAALKIIEAEPPRGIVLVTAKPSIFIAGADLNKIADNLNWPDEKIFEFSERGRSIMARFSALPETISVAAIHGVCVGGGLELPLYCDHRIASDSPRTLLGLPEVKLGLIPGWAGTVRLPRLIGFEPAVDLVVSGDLISAAESKQLGITSIVVPETHLVQTAMQIIDREHYTKGYLKQREKMTGRAKKHPKSIKQFRDSIKETIAGNTEVDPVAPTIVVEHMLKTAKVSHDEACQSESTAFAKVWGSVANRGLLHYFFLDERAKKTRPPRDWEEPELGTVGIVGAGLMGGQIARLAAAAGFNLLIFDADKDKRKNLATAVNEDPRSKAEQVASVNDLAAFAYCDMVIECIVEKPKIKKELFARLCQHVSEEAFLATNTSTIPVHEIAEAVTHPERLFGLHFCCPTEPLKLVEVIRGEYTSDLAANVALDLVRKFRKTPIVVGDQPGFVVNRLLCPVFNQAVVLLQHGIDRERIDSVFREFGFSAGPLQMIDFIGVDTIMYAGETFLRSLPDLIQLTPVFPALVKRGRLGRKTGSGFYAYSQSGTDATDSPLADVQFQSIIDGYQIEPLDLTDQQILNRLLQPMIEQGKQVLADGVVDDARDVDLCSVLGTTFPKVRGGILHWANQLRELSAPA